MGFNMFIVLRIVRVTIIAFYSQFQLDLAINLWDILFFI